MRNTLILGTLLALFGVASVVQASDRSQSRDGDTVRVSREADTIRAIREASRDGDRHDRSESKDRSRKRPGASTAPGCDPIRSRHASTSIACAQTRSQRPVSGRQALAISPTPSPITR